MNTNKYNLKCNLRKSASKNYGFSLAETLIALGVLTVGMLFVAGVFPVGIYFTNLSIERTTAAVVADEAFAKIKLYNTPGDGAQSLNICTLQDNQMTDFDDWFNTDLGYNINRGDFAYPSIPSVRTDDKQYFWAALCRRLSAVCTDPNRTVQVTVFVCKKVGAASKYYNGDFTGFVDYPTPVKITVNPVAGLNNELQLQSNLTADYRYLVSDDYTIVDDRTGRLYRVLEKYSAPANDIILLDKDFDWANSNGDIWVVPPPVQPGITDPTVTVKRVSGQYPCIGVYQKIIRF